MCFQRIDPKMKGLEIRDQALLSGQLLHQILLDLVDYLLQIGDSFGLFFQFGDSVQQGGEVVVAGSRFLLLWRFLGVIRHSLRHQIYAWEISLKLKVRRIKRKGKYHLLRSTPTVPGFVVEMLPPEDFFFCSWVEFDPPRIDMDKVDGGKGAFLRGGGRRKGWQRGHLLLVLVRASVD